MNNIRRTFRPPVAIPTVDEPKEVSPATEPSPSRYPLLESLLKQKGLKLRGIYTLDDVCEIFGAGSRGRVSRRSIQERMSTGELRSRKLPGHGKFLSDDLEDYLKNTALKPDKKRNRNDT